MDLLAQEKRNCLSFWPYGPWLMCNFYQRKQVKGQTGGVVGGRSLKEFFCTFGGSGRKLSLPMGEEENHQFSAQCWWASCRAFFSVVELPANHAVRRYVSKLSMVEQWKDTSSFAGVLFVPAAFVPVCSHSKPLGKWNCCWAFFVTAVVCVDQESSSEMWTPRNLKAVTLSTCLH